MKPFIWTFLSVICLAVVPGWMAAQHTVFDIIYCANGGENKSAGIPVLAVPNPVEKPGWRLLFSDEFDGNSLDDDWWNRSTPWDDGDGSCTRNFATSRLNDTVFDGAAHILNTNQPAVPGCSFSGGEIKTMSVRDSLFRSVYFYAPGYLETRVKLFNKTGQGSSCWLWAVGTPENPGKSGPWQEIDLFETDGINPNIFLGTYHWTWNNVHVSQNVSVYLTTAGQPYDPEGNWTIFGLEWDSAAIRWYVNNSLVKELKMSLVPPFCIDAPRYLPPLAPFCLRLSTGRNTIGNQASVADPSDFPQSMLVDYVRVYKKNGARVSPIILTDGISQVCATAVSREASDKYLRTNYYPGISYSWSSPSFELEEVPFIVPEPPGRQHLWIKPGVAAGQSYPVFLEATFPDSHVERDTVNLFISPGLPGIPPDQFMPAGIDTLCYFSLQTPVADGSESCEYSLDGGITWLPGTRSDAGAVPVFSFGFFRPRETVNLSFRAGNGCGWSPERVSSVTLPPPVDGCKWPAGTDRQQTPSRISISPNPFTDHLEVCIPGGLSGARATIYNSTGLLVLARDLQPGENRVGCGGLLPGLYFIRVITDNSVKMTGIFIRQ